MSETATLKVGDEAPDFDLPATTDDRFKLSDYRGKNAVILNFMPAAFSAPCSQHVPLVEQKRAELESQDAIPVGITCDNLPSLKAWAEQHGLGFPLLSDFNPHGATARAYGTLIEERGVANRTVVVVDKSGKVAWIQPTEQLTDMPDYDPVLACTKA